MATVSSTAVAATTYPKFHEKGVYAMRARHTFTASSGDVVQMLKVPSGFRVLDATLVHSAVVNSSAGDAIGTTFQVGDGNVAARFITISGSATALTRLNTISGGAYIYTAADTIDVTVGGLTGTGSASPTVTFDLIVYGDIDNSYV